MTMINNFKRATTDMRFYFTVVGDVSVTVYDRITHRPITYLNGFDEIKHWVDKLSDMSQEEYYDFIFSKGLKQNSRMTEAEDWFLKAWIYETEKILVKFDLEVPKTTAESHNIDTMYNEYTVRQKRRAWENEAKKSQDKPIRKFKSKQSTKTVQEDTTAETQQHSEVSKAPKKKLSRKSTRDTVETTDKPKESPSTVQAEDKQTLLQKLLDKLTEDKQNSKITFGEYIKRKRQLIAQYS